MESTQRIENDFADSLLNTAPVIVLLLDLRGNIEYANPFFEQLSGYKLDDIKGKEWFSSFLPERDVKHIREVFQKATYDEPIRNNINSIVIRGGEEREIEWSAQALRDEENTITGVLSIGQDVTERYRAEHALKEKSRRQQEILDSLFGFVGILSLDGKLLEVNDAPILAAGLSREEVINQPFAETYWWSFSEGAQDSVRDALVRAGQGETVRFDTPVQVMDGMMRTLDVMFGPLCDKAGQVTEVIGFGVDITERKKVEQKLDIKTRIIERSHNSVVSTDLDGIVVSWNAGAESLFGYSKKEALGRHVSFVFREKKHAYLGRIIRKLKQKGFYEAEVELVKKSDEDFFGYLSLSMLHDDQGKAMGMVGYTMDITERKLMEAELENYREVLETEVDMRTADLRAARDEAERANVSKSEFLSRMSHELRTPMNAILGFGQMLKLDSDQFTQTQKENVEEILEAGDHLLTLINGVLDLAKIESGKMEVSLEKLAVADVVKRCISLIDPLAKQRQVYIVDEIGENAFFVRADYIRLKQVLLNLLSNAVKYNHQQGSVTLCGEITDEKRFRLEVSDTGVGMSKKDQEKLFTSFERFGAGNDEEGAGIGLVISKQLALLMGGNIGVKSEPGKGSTFWVELELIEEE
jgi:PAS domain S-box-containing protein